MRQNGLLFILVVQMFLPFLSLVNSNMGLLVYAQPDLDSEIGVYRLTIYHIADPEYAIFQAWCFKVFLAPIVFVLFETILFWSFCVYLHNLQKRIQTFEDCI